MYLSWGEERLHLRRQIVFCVTEILKGNEDIERYSDRVGEKSF